MGVEIRRKRQSGKITGMEPPPDTVGALSHEGELNQAFLEGNRKSSDQAQRNIRILQDQIDAMELRLRELEARSDEVGEEYDDSNLQIAIKDLQDQINALKIDIDRTEGGSGVAYGGPFTVTAIDSSSVYVSDGQVILGLETINTGNQVVYLSGGFLYLKVTKSGRSYVTEFVSSGSGEEQTNTEYFHLIASRNTPDPVQIQFGNIHVAGRLV